MNTGRAISVQPPSLFPFLSVLVCMIGILMFLAVSVALTSLESAASNVELQIESNAPEHGKTPLMLECTADGAREFGGERLFQKSDEENIVQGTWQGTPFTDFLASLARDADKEYLMFVVRPDGLETFRLLRAILVLRNKDRCTKKVTLAESLEKEALTALPIEIRRKASCTGSEFSFLRVMTPEARDAIKAILTKEESKDAIDELYGQTQGADEWIDYGTELVPADWVIRSVKGNE